MVWEKSSFCADKWCIEVALVDSNTVAVRDGKDVSQPFLQFSREDWASFLDSVDAGTFEPR
jgi:hypothetical protein